MKIKIYILALIAGTLMACNSEDGHSEKAEEYEEHGAEGVVVLNKKQREALNLELGSFQNRNLTTVVKINGELTVPPSAKADITAMIGGFVKEILVFHGDKVTKGQTLAILEHPDYISLQENFLISASKLKYLEQEYNRQKKLYENNVGAGKDYEQIKSKLSVERARYESLRLRLKLLNLSPEKVIGGVISNTIKIVSPIKGYINDIDIKVGTYVDSKDKLFEVTDNSALHADFVVYENDVHLVSDGQKIHFNVSNKPGEDIEAKVFAIGKEFEPNTRAIHIHADIIGTHTGLIPRMYITGHLHTDENYTNTLPNDAIVTEGTKSYIFILVNNESDDHDHSNMEAEDEHMSFKMVEVITGRKDDRFTEVFLINSLPEDTQVVTVGAYYLLSDLNKEETEHSH